MPTGHRPTSTLLAGPRRAARRARPALVALAALAMLAPAVWPGHIDPPAASASPVPGDVYERLMRGDFASFADYVEAQPAVAALARQAVPAELRQLLAETDPAGVTLARDEVFASGGASLVDPLWQGDGAAVQAAMLEALDRGDGAFAFATVRPRLDAVMGHAALESILGLHASTEAALAILDEVMAGLPQAKVVGRPAPSLPLGADADAPGRAVARWSEPLAAVPGIVPSLPLPGAMPGTGSPSSGGAPLAPEPSAPSGASAMGGSSNGTSSNGTFTFDVESDTYLHLFYGEPYFVPIHFTIWLNQSVETMTVTVKHNNETVVEPVTEISPSGWDWVPVLAKPGNYTIEFAAVNATGAHGWFNLTLLAVAPPRLHQAIHGNVLVLVDHNFTTPRSALSVWPMSRFLAEDEETELVTYDYQVETGFNMTFDADEKINLGGIKFSSLSKFLCPPGPSKGGDENQIEGFTLKASWEVQATPRTWQDSVAFKGNFSMLGFGASLEIEYAQKWVSPSNWTHDWAGGDGALSATLEGSVSCDLIPILVRLVPGAGVVAANIIDKLDVAALEISIEVGLTGTATVGPGDVVGFHMGLTGGTLAGHIQLGLNLEAGLGWKNPSAEWMSAGVHVAASVYGRIEGGLAVDFQPRPWEFSPAPMFLGAGVEVTAKAWFMWWSWEETILEAHWQACIFWCPPEEGGDAPEGMSAMSFGGDGPAGPAGFGEDPEISSGTRRFGVNPWGRPDTYHLAPPGDPGPLLTGTPPARTTVELGIDAAGNRTLLFDADHIPADDLAPLQAAFDAYACPFTDRDLCILDSEFHLGNLITTLPASASGWPAIAGLHAAGGAWSDDGFLFDSPLRERAPALAVADEPSGPVQAVAAWEVVMDDYAVTEDAMDHLDSQRVRYSVRTGAGWSAPADVRLSDFPQTAPKAFVAEDGRTAAVTWLQGQDWMECDGLLEPGWVCISDDDSEQMCEVPSPHWTMCRGEWPMVAVLRDGVLHDSRSIAPLSLYVEAPEVTFLPGDAMAAATIRKEPGYWGFIDVRFGLPSDPTDPANSRWTQSTFRKFESCNAQPEQVRIVSDPGGLSVYWVETLLVSDEDDEEIRFVRPEVNQLVVRTAGIPGEVSTNHPNLVHAPWGGLNTLRRSAVEDLDTYMDLDVVPNGQGLRTVLWIDPAEDRLSGLYSDERRDAARDPEEWHCFSPLHVIKTFDLRPTGLDDEADSVGDEAGGEGVGGWDSVPPSDGWYSDPEAVPLPTVELGLPPPPPPSEREEEGPVEPVQPYVRTFHEGIVFDFDADYEATGDDLVLAVSTFQAGGPRDQVVVKTVGMGPDIEVLAQVDPENPRGGTTATVSTTLRNKGSVESPPGYVTYTADGAEVFQIEVPPIGPGATWTVSGNWPVPWLDAPSTLVAKWQVRNELQDVVTPELDPTNNEATLTNHPDIALLDLVSTQAGGSVTLDIVVRNVGGYELGPTTLDLMLDGSAWTTVTTPTLPIGATATVEVSLALATPGPHFIRATAAVPGDFDPANDAVADGHYVRG